MFRTRDFLLLFTTIVFLIVAIGTTIFSEWTGTSSAKDSPLQPVTAVHDAYTATVVLPETLSRQERLAEMRRKVAESESLMLAAASTEVSEEESTAESASETDGGVVSVAVSCPAPTPYGGIWPRGVSFELREGARVLYTESTVVEPAIGTGTPQTTTAQEVVLQLPVPFGPAPNPTCPANDVIGIAQDGSLIRNTEVGLYSVFGESTLIGYALDGFPIYGVSSVATDECGGAVVGTYRYYLSDNRPLILNCYSGTPVKM
ncbi:hypothetical protein KC902_01345 [Candidatus Kaiserbacteria bacterium]|nr:hypothetical protein [Candidatus Kaiserbacteria bacterium]USN88579.1 MAG: hypothetical protein H6780_03780 [Candidatus Nomurabacteria bacterium]